MRVFVYEYVTGGGLFLDGHELPGGSMLREGEAMLRAVCADLGQLPSVSLVAMRDTRLASPTSPRVSYQPVGDVHAHSATFDRCVKGADFTLLIAPEINGRLHELTARAEDRGARLLSPDSTFVALASNKLSTCRQLERAKVPVPRTLCYRGPQDLSDLPPGQLVCKPIDGAGSWQVRVTHRREVTEWMPRGRDLCVQEYCEGRPASVSALCGPDATQLLPPCWQDVEPPTFEYRGGASIDDPLLASRAHRLAQRALAAFPATRGYVGVDLVLGPSPHGDDDRVLEINPRLTTSYVGLRELVAPNLGIAMWQVACGETADLTFVSGGVQFDASGGVWWCGRSPGITNRMQLRP